MSGGIVNDARIFIREGVLRTYLVISGLAAFQSLSRTGLTSGFGCLMLLANKTTPRIQRLVELQSKRDQMLKLQTPIEKVAYKTPQQKLYVLFYAPNPEGFVSLPMPVTQYEDKVPNIHPS